MITSSSLFLSPSGQHAFLLENVPCNSASCHSVGRMLRIHWDQSDLGAIQNAVMATFFDIYEDVSNLCCVDDVSMQSVPSLLSFCFLFLFPCLLHMSLLCPSLHCLLICPRNALTPTIILLSDCETCQCSDASL